MSPPGSWPAFLRQFHHDRPGITEDSLALARGKGIDPYRWLLEPLHGIAPLLDVACGNGPVAEPGGNGWVGLDVSLEELTLARRRGALRLVRADAGRLPFADGAFPAVVCSMALMVLQPLDAVLGELSRVLSPDGVVVVMIPGTFPVTAGDLVRYGRLMLALRRSHLAYPNDRALARLATVTGAAGLRVVDDRRRRFALPMSHPDTGRLFVRSLYLPGATEQRVSAASAVAARWVGHDIGIPLRRVTLAKGGGK